MSQSTAHLALASLKKKYQSLIQQHGACKKHNARCQATVDAAQEQVVAANLLVAGYKSSNLKAAATIGILEDRITEYRNAQPALIAKLRAEIKFHKEAWYTLSKRAHRAETAANRLCWIVAVLGTTALVNGGYLTYLLYFA